MTQRFVIASDLHGSPERTAFLCDRVRELQPDALILLGDLLYHGPRNPLPSSYNTMNTVDLLSGLSSPIIAVRGNCDADVDLVVLPFPLQANAWIYVDALRIFACHGHTMPLQAPFAQLTAGTVLLRGHTHIPQVHTEDGIHLWNPGSLSLPKQGYPPTWGLYEQGEFQVIDMQGNVFLRHRPLAATQESLAT